jgi:hypothetical protein
MRKDHAATDFAATDLTPAGRILRLTLNEWLAPSAIARRAVAATSPGTDDLVAHDTIGG